MDLRGRHDLHRQRRHGLKATAAARVAALTGPQEDAQRALLAPLFASLDRAVRLRNPQMTSDQETVFSTLAVESDAYRQGGDAWDEAREAARDAWFRADRTYNTYEESDRYFAARFDEVTYRRPGETFDDFRPAYRYGVLARTRFGDRRSGTIAFASGAGQKKFRLGSSPLRPAGR